MNPARRMVYVSVETLDQIRELALLMSREPVSMGRRVSNGDAVSAAVHVMLQYQRAAAHPSVPPTPPAP